MGSIDLLENLLDLSELRFDRLECRLVALHTWTLEPVLRREHPVATGEEEYDTNGDRRVVERAPADRLEGPRLGKHQNDGNREYPDHAHPADDRAPLAERPRAVHERRAGAAAEERRDHVGDEKSDRRDRGDRPVCSHAPEIPDTEDERPHGGEPDRVRGRPRP